MKRNGGVIPFFTNIELLRCTLCALYRHTTFCARTWSLFHYLYDNVYRYSSVYGKIENHITAKCIKILHFIGNALLCLNCFAKGARARLHSIIIYFLSWDHNPYGPTCWIFDDIYAWPFRGYILDSDIFLIWLLLVYTVRIVLLFCVCSSTSTSTREFLQ